LPKDREGLARVHEAERQFVNARYKLPKMLRYKVPNIVTVFIASSGFSPEVSEYGSENTIDPIGGERHQVILVDLGRNNIVSQGTETHYVYGAPLFFKAVSPINRGVGIVWSIMDFAQPAGQIKDRKSR